MTTAKPGDLKTNRRTINFLLSFGELDSIFGTGFHIFSSLECPGSFSFDNFVSSVSFVDEYADAIRSDLDHATEGGKMLHILIAITFCYGE